MPQRRAPNPPQLTINLRPGPRSPAWDRLWQHILYDVLSDLNAHDIERQNADGEDYEER